MPTVSGGFGSTSTGPVTAAIAGVQADTDALQIAVAADKAVDDAGATAAALTALDSKIGTPQGGGGTIAFDIADVLGAAGQAVSAATAAQTAVESGVFGVAAIKTAVDAKATAAALTTTDGRLTDGTNGLAAIKTAAVDAGTRANDALIAASAAQTAVESGVFGNAAIKTAVDAKATASALAITDAVCDDILLDTATLGTPVNTGGVATLAAQVGDTANSSLVTRVAAVKTDTGDILTDTADMQPKLGAPAGASISADIAAVKADTAAILAAGGGATQASVDAIAADVGDSTAIAGVSLAAMLAAGLQVFKISDVSADSPPKLTLVAYVAGTSPSPVGATNWYANQMIWKVAGSAPLGVTARITTNTAGVQCTVSSALTSAAVNDVVVVLPRPDQAGVNGDSLSDASVTLHAKLGAPNASAANPGATAPVFAVLSRLYQNIGSFDTAGGSQTSLKALLLHASMESAGKGIAAMLAMGLATLYTIDSTGNGTFRLVALSGGAPVPAAADACRGGVVHVLNGTHEGKKAFIHSYTTGAVVRHTLTGVSFGNGSIVAVEWPKVGARVPATWHPWDLPAVMVTQATDVSVPDQEVTVTQTTTSATYVVLEKKTWTAADCPNPIDWIKANRLVWTSDMSNAGTGETKWYISPESATETVNAAPSGSAVAISDGQAAAAAKTTHYLNAISPVLTAALPANGGFHLLLAGKADGAETLTCTVFASSYATIG